MPPIEVAVNPALEVHPADVKKSLDAHEDLFLLDCRQLKEWNYARIEGATLIPLGELQKRYEELDPSRDLVVFCKIGGRSAKAVSFLKEHGFPQAINLKGGILAWSDQVDPSQPRY